MQYRQKCLSQKINVCNICGASEDLAVHHINADRRDNRLENLVPLCSSCHRDVHRKGDHAVGLIKEYQNKLPEWAFNGHGPKPDEYKIGEKLNKTLSLDRDVIDVLEKEDNQSGTVNQLLRDKYNL